MRFAPPRFSLFLIAALAVSFIAALPSQAAPTYSVYPPIRTQAGRIPDNSNIYKEGNVQTVRVGQTVAVWVDVAVDADSWTDGTARGTTNEPVRYRWTGGRGARFTSVTNERFATWQAPNRLGTHPITCVINDSPDHADFNRDKRDDTLVTLKTSVRVVSGAPIWLESDIERSYQLNSSTGRRVKMPDGAIQVKTVHSVATWNTTANRWIGGSGLTGRGVVARRSDGTETNGEWSWTINDYPAGGGTDNRIAVRNQELRVNSNNTLTPQTSVAATRRGGGARMNIAWHKPYENVWTPPTPSRLYSKYSPAVSVDIPTPNGLVYASQTDVDIHVVRQPASSFLRTAREVIDYVSAAGSSGAGIIIRNPVRVAVIETLVSIVSVAVVDVQPEDVPITKHNSYEMWKNSVNADRSTAASRAARGEPLFLDPPELLGLVRLGGERNDRMWSKSALHSIGIRNNYSRYPYTAREYNEHGYVGRTQGVEDNATTVNHMGHYYITDQPGQAGRPTQARLGG